MDEDRPDEPHPGTGSFFRMKRTWLIMITIAIIAVYWGMGGQRGGQDKSADVYSAEQRAAERADEVAGFGRSEDKK